MFCKDAEHVCFIIMAVIRDALSSINSFPGKSVTSEVPCCGVHLIRRALGGERRRFSSERKDSAVETT